MNVIREFKDRCIIIRVREESIRIRGSLKEAVRRCWRANLQRAKKADYVLAIIGTSKRIEGVFKPKKWYCLDDNFCREQEQECKKYETNTELCAIRKRIAFDGEKIINDVKYLHKVIPDEYLPAMNPFRYTY
jgi:hypothetical protein